MIVWDSCTLLVPTRLECGIAKKLISITYWDILSWIMLIIMWRPPSVRTRNLTYREEALDPLSVVHGERVRGGGGGEGELHWGQAADPLSHLGEYFTWENISISRRHLLASRHRLAGPVEGARDEVSDLVLPLLSLPAATNTTSYFGLVIIRHNNQS